MVQRWPEGLKFKDDSKMVGIGVGTSISELNKQPGSSQNKAG
jgi:hypothetical protein